MNERIIKGTVRLFRASIWKAVYGLCTEVVETENKGLSGEIKVRAKDFLKNMKILSSKYFIDVHLYENFCALVDRDLKEECKCSKKPCPKSCLMLDFCNLADVLDSISTVHYVFKEKVKNVNANMINLSD